MTTHAPLTESDTHASRQNDARPLVTGQEPISGPLARTATEGGERPGDEPSMREVWEVALLAVVPEGRESAIPWSVVAERAAEKVREVLPDRSFKPETVLRRCQEAAARLRRAKEPVNVVGLSGIGVFIAASPDDLRFRSSQQWRRIRSQIEEARAFDAASADRILAAMGQLGLDLEAA